MDADLLCSDPAGALGSAQRTPFHFGASLPGSQHRSLVGQSPFQHLAWPGTGVGWCAPGPLFVSKNGFPAPLVDPVSLPARERGGWPAFPGTTSVSALLLSCSSALLCFPQTLFCRAKGILEIK